MSAAPQHRRTRNKIIEELLNELNLDKNDDLAQLPQSDRVVEAGGIPSHINGEEVESVQELDSIEAIKSMLPVEDIQEIESINEVKNIEEINDDVAEQFIKDEGLNGDVNPFKVLEEEEAAIEGEIEKQNEIIDVLEDGIAVEEEKIDVLEDVENEHEALKENLEDGLESLKKAIEAKLNEKVDDIQV